MDLFAGQGVVQETLSFSQVPHFNVGGSLHLVVNNQVSSSIPSLYCTHFSKMN